MIGLDTNVLLRLYVRDDSAQAAAATRYVRRRCSRENPGYVNRATLCEFVWVLDRTYGYERRDIATLIRGLATAPDLTVEDAQEAERALAEFEAGHDFADAYIGWTNRANGCHATATFDRRAAKMRCFEPIR